MNWKPERWAHVRPRAKESVLKILRCELRAMDRILYASPSDAQREMSEFRDEIIAAFELAIAELERQ